MTGEKRRQAIMKQLLKAQKPLSASALAKKFKVSRQIIVGDIALIRASGVDITATTRGYLLTPDPSKRFIGKIVCKHQVKQTKEELETIVALGGTVIDVIVEHQLYGELIGKLNIGTQEDIDDFFKQFEQQQRPHLLSELTEGIHLHTIACDTEETFAQIKMALSLKKFLYEAV